MSLSNKCAAWRALNTTENDYDCITPFDRETQDAMDEMQNTILDTISKLLGDEAWELEKDQRSHQKASQRQSDLRGNL